MNISIINGPNLNLLGRRETDIYGSKSFEEFLDAIKGKYPNVNFEYFQSNIEGESGSWFFVRWYFVKCRSVYTYFYRDWRCGKSNNYPRN